MIDPIDILSVTDHMVLCRRGHQTGSHSSEAYGTWIPWGQLRAFARLYEQFYANALKEARRLADLKGMRRWAIQAPPFASNLYNDKDQANVALPTILKLWQSILIRDRKDASLSATVVAIDPDEVFNWRSSGENG